MEINFLDSHVVLNYLTVEFNSLYFSLIDMPFYLVGNNIQ